MKTTKKQFRTIAFILNMLIIFTVFLSGCSKDDETNNDIVLCDTFLECNNLTKWKQVFLENGVEIARIYLRIDNNLNNPFENWLNISPNSCHISMRISDHQIEILENSKDKFIIKIVWQEDSWQQDEFETWTFTKQGDSLKLVTKYFQEIITYDFKSTSDDFDNLEICTD
jgi:hypothetical protein